jgi:hypothetical protein
MKHSIGALFAFIISASLLTACGPGTTGFPPVTGNNCGPPPEHMEVLYPIPNSRRAPGDLGTIYVATDARLLHADGYNFFLTQSNGSSTATSRFFGTSTSQIPRPHARSTYATPFYYATTIPSHHRIGPRQSVNLYWNIPGAGCAAHTLVSSFRTRRARS